MENQPSSLLAVTKFATAHPPSISVPIAVTTGLQMSKKKSVIGTRRNRAITCVLIVSVIYSAATTRSVRHRDDVTRNYSTFLGV